MIKTLKRMSRVYIFTFALIFITAASTYTAMGATDFKGIKSIKPGLNNAFRYSIRNFKNQRFTISVFFNETVPTSYWLLVFCIDRQTLTDLEQGRLTPYNLTETSGEYLFYYNVSHSEYFEVTEVIPDWEEWTFMFLNLNENEMMTYITIKRQHVLWWLGLLLPLLAIGGLVSYYVAERVTRYERARMDNEKAIKKLSSRKESERKKGAYWLISNGTEKEIEILRKKLDDANPIVRENAAFALGGISKRLGDKSSSKILLEKYKVETELPVKESIVGALCDVGDISALSIFEKYLHSEHNEQLRYKIATALGDIGHIKAAATLVKVLENKNTDALKLAARGSLKKIAKNAGESVESLINKYSKK
ncbi:MAG: HEAT repeat domain-containing protein [Candidatus Heimdallarchaeota archaeon]